VRFGYICVDPFRPHPLPFGIYLLSVLLINFIPSIG